MLADTPSMALYRGKSIDAKSATSLLCLPPVLQTDLAKNPTIYNYSNLLIPRDEIEAHTRILKPESSYGSIVGIPGGKIVSDPAHSGIRVVFEFGAFPKSIPSLGKVQVVHAWDMLAKVATSYETPNTRSLINQQIIVFATTWYRDHKKIYGSTGVNKIWEINGGTNIPSFESLIIRHHKRLEEANDIIMEDLKNANQFVNQQSDDNDPVDCLSRLTF